MNRTYKRLSLITLLFLMTAAFAFGAFFIIGAKAAEGAENIGVGTSPLTMADGASLRLGTDHNGLRFSAKLNEESDPEAEYHIVIVPEEYLDGYVSGDYVDYLTSFIADKNEQFGTDVELIDQVCEPVMIYDENGENGQNGRLVIRASITDILFDNAARNFSAIAYKLKDGTKTYSDIVTRDLASVAVKALGSGDYNGDAAAKAVIEKYVENGMKKTLGLSETDEIPAYYINPETYILRIIAAEGEKDFSFEVYDTENKTNVSSLNKFVYAVSGDSRISYQNGKMVLSGEITENFVTTVDFRAPGLTHAEVTVEVILDPLNTDIFSEWYNVSSYGWVPQATANLGRSFDAENQAIKISRLNDFSTNSAGFTSANNRIYFTDLTALKAAYEAGYRYMSFEYYSTLGSGASGEYYGFRIYYDTVHNNTSCGTEIITYTGSTLKENEWASALIDLETLFGDGKNAYTLSFVACGGAGSTLMLRNTEFTETMPYVSLFDETATQYFWTGVLNCQITKTYDYSEEAMKLTAGGAGITNSDRHHAIVIDKIYFEQAIDKGYNTFIFSIKGDAAFVADNTSGFSVYSNKNALKNGENDNRNNEGALFDKTYAFAKTVGTDLSSDEYTTVKVNLSALLAREGMTGVGIWLGGASGSSVYIKGGTFAYEPADIFSEDYSSQWKVVDGTVSIKEFDNTENAFKFTVTAAAHFFPPGHTGLSIILSPPLSSDCGTSLLFHIL